MEAHRSLFLVQMSPRVIGVLGRKVREEDRFSRVLEVRNTVLYQNQLVQLESSHCFRSWLTFQIW